MIRREQDQITLNDVQLGGQRVLFGLIKKLQVYDRVPIWASYLLMIFVGRYVLMALLSPALELVYYGLIHS